MSIRFLVLILVMLTILGTGCNSSPQGELTPATAPPVMTSTLPAASPLAASGTPPLPSPQPTAPRVTPVDGVTSTQVNVRAEPSTAGNVLGVILPDMRVEITGKDPAGKWWQINYAHPDAVDGKGWVTAQYITAADTSQIPVIGGTETEPNNGNVAIVQQQINVRSGPGTDFNSLGTLNPQDVVSLTGKDPNGAWLQIVFTAGPEGKGWINAAFVRTQGAENLPIIAESGLVVGTGTPTSIAPAPTPTVVPAREDNDSDDNPLVSVTFDPAGTRTFIYNGDVSAPSGDREDWIQFTPFNGRVLLEISCKGNDLLIEIIQNGQALDQAACGTQQFVSIVPDVSVQVHISAHLESVLSYSSYTVKVSAIQ